MNHVLSNPKRLITLSILFVVLGVVLAGVGLTKNSELWGAIGMTMLFPAAMGFFRVMTLPSSLSQSEVE